MFQQPPSPAYTHSSQGSIPSINSNLDNEMMTRMSEFFGDMNQQMLNMRQQQASSMNSLDALARDVANLNDQVKKMKSGTSSRGGRGGRGSRGGNRGGQAGTRRSARNAGGDEE